MIYVQRTHVKGSLLGSLHGAGEPGQGFRAVDRQRLNDSLSDIVRTLHYAGHLENVHMKVWGAARKVARKATRKATRKAVRGEVQSWDVPCVDCGSGYMLQQGFCDICATHVHEGVAPGVATWCRQAWARVSSCRPSETE